jgi:hypothetical protein
VKTLASEAECLWESLEVDRKKLLTEMAYICLRYGTEGSNKKQRSLEAGDRSHGPKVDYSAIKVVETTHIDDLACD